jgi:competence protein ComEC
MTLIYLACAWLLGLYLSSLLQLPAWPMGVAAVLCIGASLACQRYPRAQLAQTRVLRLGGFCLLMLSLGIWRYERASPILTPGPLAAYNDGDAVTLHGLIVNDPVARDRTTQMQIAVHELKGPTAWLPITGLVLVQTPSYQDYRYGDDVEISGQLETPSDYEDFSYRAYLAHQGIHSLLLYPRITVLERDKGQPLLAFLYAVKRRTQRVIAAILPEPQAALLTGILLGNDEGIPRSLLDQFRATGTAHIIAISGFNITIISAALVKLFNRFLQRYVALLVALAVIALYVVLVGAEPPVVRAAIMGGLATLALIVGRQNDGLTSLLLTASLMTAWQPMALWDVSFQISFAAMLGLILYADRLARWVESTLGRWVTMETAERLTGLSRDTLLATTAAQITVLPLMAYHFGQFSPLTLLANLLVLPVQPVIMYLGSTAALLGLALLPVGTVIGWAAWLFLTYTIRTTEVLSTWAGPASSTAHLHPAALWVYYALLAIVTWKPLHSRLSQSLLHPAHLAGLIQHAAHVARSLPRWLSLLHPARSAGRQGMVRKGLVVGLVMVLVLVWAAVFSLPDGRLHVTFLDVGQGDAIFIQTPAGHRILIDGGPSPATVLQALGRRLPFYDRRIDLVLLSHPHDDHLRGLLAVVERYGVRQVLSGSMGDSTPTGVAAQWQQLLHDRNIPLLSVAQPLQIDLGDGPVMQVLPSATDEDPGQTCLVARLSWGDTSFLFTGDLEADGLLRLASQGWPLDCAVLKVPHHGSADGLNEDLWVTMKPRLAVISVGADNLFGHPAASTLELLAEQGVETLRTDQVGDIELTADAQGWQAKVRSGVGYRFAD